MISPSIVPIRSAMMGSDDQASLCGVDEFSRMVRAFQLTGRRVCVEPVAASHDAKC